MDTDPPAGSPLFPEGFIDRLQTIVPHDAWPRVLASLYGLDVVGLRVNTLLAPAEQIFAELASQQIDVQHVDWLPNAGMVPVAVKLALTTSTAVLEGRVYVQALASQLAPLALAPSPGEQVLDLAAAPGGKTLQMAALMQGQGNLAAVEPVAKRFHVLRENVCRAGASDLVKLYQTDGRTVGKKTPERFDAVLLDAPCTSEARFAAGDASTWRYWGPRKIAESARKQKSLLRSAIDAVRVGGRVVYATCSFSPEENEAVVAHVLKRLPGAVEVEPLHLPVPNIQPGLVSWLGKHWPAELSNTARVLPTSEMTGFFVARLVKQRPTATGGGRR
jgi:16S rRNA (cytosine1407-C5)-methyltransferase